MRHPLSLLVLASATLPQMAAAQSASDVADLAGARAAGGETQLLARGYEARHSTVVGEQRYTFWFNARTGRCLSVSTADGRYGALISVPPENCDADESRAEPDHDARRVDAPRDPGSLILVCYGAGTRATGVSLGLLSESDADRAYAQKAVKKAKPKKQMTTVDPDAVVQTGPGLPRWGWQSVTLAFSGPVQKDQRIELVLLSPAANLALAFCLGPGAHPATRMTMRPM